MNERERWVVYPLIFFLFLMSMRDSVSSSRIECDELTCGQLSVKTVDGRDLVYAGGQMGAGVVAVYGPQNGDASLDRGESIPLLEMGGQSSGGYIYLFGSGKPDLMLGHHESLRVSGLLAVDGADQPLKSSVSGDKALWGPTVAWDEPQESNSAATGTNDKGGEADASAQGSETGNE